MILRHSIFVLSVSIVKQNRGPSITSPYIASRKTAAKNAAAANTTPNNTPATTNGGLFSFLTGSKKQKQNPQQRSYGDVGTLVKLRKAPIKIEPKVFFANERTFLAWLHLSVILAGASIAILAFADDSAGPFAQLYGVVLLPVAISFIIYAMYQYNRRATMIRHRHPGPYEDTVGPTVLGIMLMVSITAQFALKMYALASL
jgi:uncharacterized membrane protein YidH (DUF202 family)